ncbi:hypothetical protein [Pengzhenrongella phosphoraccumulans]|uniref:rolling circle replication-associated protein n=1 Tax=Pengzhenrongella phosphoraccumulans TaxID=3114394 RepID=UPI00388F7F37
MVGVEVVGPVLREPRLARWVLSLYPKAGEGGGCFVSSRPPTRPAYVARGSAKDPERAAEEAGRRARGRLRRYAAANRLNKLGTLTYAGTGCHDPRQVRADVGEFFRALREGLGGAPLPYVWVPEWHKTDHGLHAHFAVARYVPKTLIRQAWGRGFVHIKLLGDLPVGSGPLAEARLAARYLSKYVTKTFTDDNARIPGLHRYDLAQGFQPPVLRLRGRSSDDVLGQASQLFGMAPAYQWNSTDTEGWSGPPAIWAQWAG